MNRYLVLLILISCSCAATYAQESTGLSDEDRLFINETTRNYNLCIQENSLQQLDLYTDIRHVAARAVELCEYQFDQLKKKLADKSESGLFTGMERSIKNRAIRNLLPLLMYEKSSRQSTEAND